MIFFSKPLFTLKRKIELTNIQQYPTDWICIYIYIYNIYIYYIYIYIIYIYIISIGEKDKKLKNIKRQENVVVLKYTNK